ncbi:MAG: response regulator transcription factor [Alphaproteobacteria bacterium]|nr:response regulator transcription factor [Alphaproteobacteria bacterium]
MKFLIADDHELFLQGLEFILRKEFPNAEIVLCSNYKAIFETLDKQTDFDLIISDLAMPGANWLEALGKIHRQCPDVPVIIISAVFDREILQKTYDIGVSGYISKSFPNSIIVGAIRLVLAGGIYIPPELLRMGMQNQPEMFNLLLKDAEEAPKNNGDNAAPETEKPTDLTPRQLEVLQCLAEGLSNKQIAYKLGLSEGTVKIHITLLMRALKVNNRTSAVREAMKRGILNVEEYR